MQTSTVKDLYENGECPDCGTIIPENAEFETACENCGHVFNPCQPED